VIVGSRPSTSSKRRRIPTQNGVAPAEGGLFNNAPPGGVISHPELLRRFSNLWGLFYLIFKFKDIQMKIIEILNYPEMLFIFVSQRVLCLTQDLAFIN